MKVQGWESLLDVHILSARGVDFQWGINDCVLWCADWIEKATGIDLAARYRGAYTNEQEATALLRGGLGFSSIADMVSAHLPPVTVKKAQRGDIMLHPAQDMLGICGGAFAYFITKDGFTRIPFTMCEKAWKVG